MFWGLSNIPTKKHALTISYLTGGNKVDIHQYINWLAVMANNYSLLQSLLDISAAGIFRNTKYSQGY